MGNSVTTISQFVGGNKPPINIVTHAATATTGWGLTWTDCTFVGIKEILSGALTAATLKTLLDISGSGNFKVLGIYTKDATSRTLRLKVTIDGTVVFDNTSAAIATTHLGTAAIGIFATPAYVVFDSVHFDVSFKVEVASSLSETDKVAIGVIYDITV